MFEDFKAGVVADQEKKLYTKVFETDDLAESSLLEQIQQDQKRLEELAKTHVTLANEPLKYINCQRCHFRNDATVEFEPDEIGDCVACEPYGFKSKIVGELKEGMKYGLPHGRDNSKESCLKCHWCLYVEYDGGKGFAVYSPEVWLPYVAEHNLRLMSAKGNIGCRNDGYFVSEETYQLHGENSVLEIQARLKANKTKMQPPVKAYTPLALNTGKTRVQYTDVNDLIHTIIQLYPSAAFLTIFNTAAKDIDGTPFLLSRKLKSITCTASKSYYGNGLTVSAEWKQVLAYIEKEGSAILKVSNMSLGDTNY
jgi:hypothetical protein